MFTCINVYWAIMADLRGSMTFTPAAERLTRLGSVASQDSNPRPPACEVNGLPIDPLERRFIQIKKRTNRLTNVFSCCVELIDHNVDLKQDCDVTFGHSSYNSY